LFITFYTIYSLSSGDRSLLALLVEWVWIWLIAGCWELFGGRELMLRPCRTSGRPEI